MTNRYLKSASDICIQIVATITQFSYHMQIGKYHLVIEPEQDIVFLVGGNMVPHTKSTMQHLGQVQSWYRTMINATCKLVCMHELMGVLGFTFNLCMGLY